jgi:hypothetical protein
MTTGTTRYLTRTAAAEHIRSLGLPVTRGSLNKWASVGGGPRYHRFGSRAVYTVDDLDAWVRQRLGAPVVSTTTEGGTDDAS